MSIPTRVQAAYSIGQLAKRWGVSPERIKSLVDSGKLPGAFLIPSAGRYGAALRIPRQTVDAIEQQWQVTPPAKAEPSLARTNRNSRIATLKHFPELGPLLDAECPADDRC